MSPADATSSRHGANPATVRPVVVVSQCLGFAAVRFNGAIIHDDFVGRLTHFVDIVEVCPEVAIGLGVPRDPIRMQTSADGVALVQPATSRDLTHSMRAFADEFLATLSDVDGFILKSRSPSCGIADVKVFEGDTAEVLATGSGVFADAVRRRFGDAAATDELQLRDREARHRFLRRIFTFARFRDARRSGTRASLMEFHMMYRDQLTAASAVRLNELNRIVAAQDDGSWGAYQSVLTSILAHDNTSLDLQTGFEPFPRELA